MSPFVVVEMGLLLGMSLAAVMLHFDLERIAKGIERLGELTDEDNAEDQT